MPSGIYPRNQNQWHHLEETKRKISKAHKGMKKPWARKPHSEETKKKMSLAKKGCLGYWLNKKRSEESKEKMSIAQIERWDRDGRKIYKRYIHPTGLKEYREWRMAVFLRDNFTCQFCGIRGCYLEAHHIKSWAKYPKLRYEIKNGVTLCRECHKLTDNYKNKKNK